MLGLNNVQIIGNLGGAPDMKYVNNNDHVVNFSVAVNERWKNRNGDPQERTTWLRIVAFNGLGSACAEFLKRGDPVYVEGRNALGRVQSGNIIDWLGNPRINLFAVLVAASWRHVGYMMVIYLAGLKSVDPTLREAAKVDGANEIQTFFRVIFPVMAPINIVIVVITAIEALRAFDIAFIINQGKNGLELLSILITNNSVSEASLVGFGSAIAVVLLVISLGPIITFLSQVMRNPSS